MKILSSYSRHFVLLSLTAGTCLLGVKAVSANPIPTIDQVERKEATQSANQLGGAQAVQRTSPELNTPPQEPKLEIKGKSYQSRGFLDVLSGRFNDEDRHPSFRKLEQQR